jgi:hypothetical protein
VQFLQPPKHVWGGTHLALVLSGHGVLHVLSAFKNDVPQKQSAHCEAARTGRARS